MKYKMLMVLLVLNTCFADIDLTPSKQEDAGDSVRLFNAGSASKTRLYSVSLDEAKKSVWRGNGEPPLSLGKALKISRNHIKETVGTNKQYEPHSVEINKAIDDRKVKNAWFYVITFVPQPYGFKEYAKHRITVVVTMGGRVVAPTIR